MSAPLYEPIARDGAARAGMLHTRRGDVPTPAFMPVATQGTGKAVTHEALGCPVVLSTPYRFQSYGDAMLIR